jgi:uncharacterized membrane protein YoaK (UPF0700 family)
MTRRLVPGNDALVPLLLSLTVVTGVVDAVSYLALGHVFVANMTGNVVFLGFALVGAPGLRVPPSLVALAAFLAGAVVGGRLANRVGAHRGRHLTLATSISALLVLAAFLVGLLTSDPGGGAARYLLIVLLGFAMGVQNATSRRLAVPDATTTVLTLTLTGLAADSILAGGTNPRPWRRLSSVLCMFAGALVGAAIVLHAGSPHTGVAIALALATAVLAVTAGLAGVASRATTAEAWA